jgi:TyrR family helix-turn-helix protein
VKFILFSHEIGQGLQKTAEVKASDHTLCFSLKEQINTYEKKIVMEALQTSRSIREAARRLSISHTALLNKLKKWKHKEPLHTKYCINYDLFIICYKVGTICCQSCLS